MSKLEIDDPVLLDRFKADDRGRITLGDEVAGREVTVCLVEIHEGGD